MSTLNAGGAHVCRVQSVRYVDRADSAAASPAGVGQPARHDLLDPVLLDPVLSIPFHLLGVLFTSTALWVRAAIIGVPDWAAGTRVQEGHSLDPGICGSVPSSRARTLLVDCSSPLGDLGVEAGALAVGFTAQLLQPSAAFLKLTAQGVLGGTPLGLGLVALGLRALLQFVGLTERRALVGGMPTNPSRRPARRSPVRGRRPWSRA